MPYRAALTGAEFHRVPKEAGGMVVRVTVPLDYTQAGECAYGGTLTNRAAGAARRTP